MDTLQDTISLFRNGGMSCRGVADKLFILRGIIDHAVYLRKQLCMTFYDIEKCFDSLWLGNGIKNDLLSLMYSLNTNLRLQ